MSARPFILGLTGSIGMGKTSAGEHFHRMGVPVFDADRAVASLYGGKAVPLIEAAFPGTTGGGIVERETLAARVLADPAAIRRLEAIVHPLVRAEEHDFIARAGAAGCPIAVLDIPLLLETGGELRCDAVAVVSAPAEMQRQRVLARSGMTIERLQAILRRQMPDEDKRRRAHFIIDTSRSHADTRRQIEGLLRALSGRPTRQMSA